MHHYISLDNGFDYSPFSPGWTEVQAMEWKVSTPPTRFLSCFFSPAFSALVSFSERAGSKGILPLPLHSCSGQLTVICGVRGLLGTTLKRRFSYFILLRGNISMLFFSTPRFATFSRLLRQFIVIKLSLILIGGLRFIFHCCEQD